jgi:hypothetical protein
MALVLEGGYDLVALEGSMMASMVGMLGPDGLDPAKEPARAPDDEAVIRAARSAQKAWAAVT